MLLEIRHLTQYHYAQTVRESVMELWMQPWKGAGQRLISFELDLDPAARLFSYADPYGNAVYHFDVPQPHDRLDILARSAVETQAPTPLPERLDSGEWNRLRSDFVRGEHLDFLRPHGFVENTAALAAFIDKHGLNELRPGDPLMAVRAVSKAIHDSLDYQAGATTAESRIDEALGLGRGVCQDFSHIMIAILRSWGIPARYVSGYLFTDRDLGDRSDPDATHAWVEAYIPFYGWLGLDPTNNCIVNDSHVRLAIGRKFSDCSPVKGTYKGTAKQTLEVGVSVSFDDKALWNEVPAILTPQAITVTATEDSNTNNNSYRKHMQMIQQQQ